jgi:lipopolysaccharide/colanic/teichoic acid biosynthesis glycosyltransferase
MMTQPTHYPPAAESRALRQTASGEGGIPSWKRVLDVACITAALPLLVPVGLLLGGLIKLLSPGPALFKQQRVGYRGKRFLCLKFRTMVVNADSKVHQGHFARLIRSDEPMVKLDHKGDPRLIPGGWLLRSLGLDELPQLINVLRGEMSLVGPRPCIPYEYEHYPPRYRRRCETLPGLTGLWQVNGKNRTTFEQMINYDLEYVENKSLLLDVRILAMTLPAIVKQACETRRGRAQARRTLSEQGCARGDACKGRSEHDLGDETTVLITKERYAKDN